MEYAKTKKIVWNGEEIPVVDMDAVRLIADGIMSANRGPAVFSVRDNEDGEALQQAVDSEDVREMLSDGNLKEFDITDYLVLCVNEKPIVACDAWL